MSHFTNKRIWITGASSGIGRALAIAFDRAGARCILSARSEDGLAETLRMCEHSERHEIVALDVTNHQRVSFAVRSVVGGGPIDILINNAGRSQRSTVLDTDMDVYRQLMDVNYFGVVHMTKEILPHMIASGSGSLVTISSIAGKVGPPYRSGYAASKHALHGFFDSLRAETSHHGIHTLVVCPGYVNTPIAHNAIAGDGSSYAKSDEENANGLDAADVAQKILKAIQKEKTEVYFGKFEVNAVRLKRFLPSVLTKMLHKKYLDKPK